MKRLLVILAMALSIVGFTALSAQAIFTLNFDENGNATVDGSPESGTVVSPGPDNITSALAYSLPEFVGGGAVRINDPDGSISDFLVFGGATVSFTETMYFLSDPGTDLADLSAADWQAALGLYSNAAAVVTEASDGTFTFLAGGGGNNVYNGTSSPSAVPEPSTMLLLGIGLSGLVAFKTRSSRRA